jgi:hypothetical protein
MNIRNGSLLTEMVPFNMQCTITGILHVYPLFSQSLKVASILEQYCENYKQARE